MAVGFRSGGRGFQIDVAVFLDWWLWASDRTTVGFRSNFRLWVLGLMGFVLEYVCVSKHLMYVCVPHWLGMNLVTSL